MSTPQVYICLRHKVLGRLPFFNRWFHIHLTKDLGDFNLDDLAVLDDFLTTKLHRWTWSIMVYRDLWPEEVRRYEAQAS